jgi:DNA-binding NtrC family response regulator
VSCRPRRRAHGISHRAEARRDAWAPGADAMSDATECTVLLVDDEPDFVTVLAERLAARGLAVTTATRGEEAVTKVRTKAFDAILLDMAMPGMDGVETLTRLLAINPDLQVILLTGRATLGQAVAAMKLGALDLIEKPAAIETLVEKIDAAARRHWQLQDKRVAERMDDILHKKGW